MGALVAPCPSQIVLSACPFQRKTLSCRGRKSCCQVSTLGPGQRWKRLLSCLLKMHSLFAVFPDLERLPAVVVVTALVGMLTGPFSLVSGRL